MLRCCRRKYQRENSERIFLQQPDYLSIGWGGADRLDCPGWPEYSHTLPEYNSSTITTLNAVQPSARAHVSMRRLSSTNEGSSLNVSHSSSQSESVCSPDTYPVDLSYISYNIRDSLLVTDSVQEDDVISTERPGSGRPGDWEVKLPTVHFSVLKVPTVSGYGMEVLLKAVSDLPHKGRGLVYDPTAVLTLLPANRQTHVTTPLLQTLNPQFQQTFTFYLTPQEKNHTTSSLRITVYDATRRKKHMQIGHVILPDVESVLTAGNPVDYQLVLGKSSVIHGHLGEVFITLSFSRKQKCLTIGLLRVRSLVIGESSGSLNKELRAKVSMLFAGDKVKTKRSGVICQSPNPFINENFDFYVPGSLLDEITVVVSLVLGGFLSPSVLLGRVIIGPYSRPGGIALNYWALVVQSDRTIKDWYTLHL